jgi:hypothetical protein
MHLDKVVCNVYVARINALVDEAASADKVMPRFLSKMYIVRVGTHDNEANML